MKHGWALAVIALVLAACGGGGAATPPSATPTVVITNTPQTPSPTFSPSSSQLSIYYTPVMSFYSGELQSIPNVGSFPSDFVAAVQTQGSGKIGDNDFLNYNGSSFTRDTLPRDAQGHPLLPYLSAAADASLPYGAIVNVACSACSSYSWPHWLITDRAASLAKGQIRLYVGLQTSAVMNQPSFANATATVGAAATAPWIPNVNDSYQWILSTPLDTTSNATVYDIDAFDAAASDVGTLHALGRHAVCYIDVGSLENYRPDASSFPSSVIGNAYTGYPTEKWLDIRRIDLLGPLMQARFDLCASKGFDAVEPDNIDGFENASGFTLTAADQAIYNTWIATIAHERHLAVALKNDADQLSTLQPYFDFGVEESCFQQGWCSSMSPMRNAGKPVFAVEYAENTSQATFAGIDCPQSRTLGFSALYKHLALDSWVQYCP